MWLRAGVSRSETPSKDLVVHVWCLLDDVDVNNYHFLLVTSTLTSVFKDL